MEGKIRILFYNLDGAGVNYYRTLTPAMEIENNFSNEIHVEINPNLNFNDPNIINYLKTFHIIHYHRQLVNDTNYMILLKNELNKNGTILVMDIDDYWYLHKNHPLYFISNNEKLHQNIIDNIKIANYITTTSEYFANEIKSITKKDNVYVLENSINPELMKQFQNNWKPDPNGKVRITYMAGSSHLGDIKQLEGVFNALSNDFQVKDKFKIIIAGWDAQGTVTDIEINNDLIKDLYDNGLWNNEIINKFNKFRGDLDKIDKIPKNIKDKYRNNTFTSKTRDSKSEESVYYSYEKILTDNHKIIKNKDYLRWLLNFERSNYYGDEDNFARRWTKKANIYATVLDETDIVIAPLDDNKFNNMKSNLKQVECWSRKLPIICSDVKPYNVDGKHMDNCILVKSDKNHSYKEWKKYLKMLILDSDLRKKLGENLYNDFSVKYNLTNVTKKRIEYYKFMILNELKND